MYDSYTNLYPVKVTCNREDEFIAIWNRAFNELKSAKTTSGKEFSEIEIKNIDKVKNQLNNGQTVTPKLVETLMRQLNGSKFLYIFDKFDNIRTKKSVLPLLI